MKRFLSALTALCMCASMTVTSLPASAVTVRDLTAVNAQADGLTWSLSKTEYDPASGDPAVISVFVENDPGVFGYEFNIEVSKDGTNYQTLDKAGFDIIDISQGDAYSFSSFQPNVNNGHVAAAENKKTENQKAANGASMVDFYVMVPSNAKAGDVFKIRIKDYKAGNYNKENVPVSTVDGTLTIAGGTDTPTDEPTEKPTDKPTEAPTEKPTENSSEDISDIKDWTWVVEDSVYEIGVDDAAIINVVSAGTDPGIFGYDFNITTGGKTLDQAGFMILDISQGEAYDFNTFQPNVENGHVGATETRDSVTADYKATAGTVIATYMVMIPDGAKAGDEYEIEIVDASCGNYNKQELKPKVKGGTLKIVGQGEKPTEGQTEKPTEKPTEKTTEKPTESSEPQDIDSIKDWTWVVEDSTYKLGSEDPAIINVISAGKDPGIFGYDFNITTGGKTLDQAGFMILDIAQGDAYDFNTFQPNVENGHVGATETRDSVTADYVATAGTVIATYMVMIPEDAKVGDEYKISIVDASCGNYDKKELAPAVMSGTLKIVGDEDPTEAPTDKPTDAPTDAPTDEATEAPTDKTTEAPTEKTTDAPYEEKTSEVDAKWDIADVTAKPGETVEVPVTISGNEGFNSVTAKFTVADGPVLKGVTAGDSFAALATAFNPDNNSVGGTDYQSKVDLTANGDVFVLSFTVPTTAKNGDKYSIDFASLNVANYDMVKLIPKTEAGSITIVSDDEPTDEWVDSSESVSGKWVIGKEYAEPGETVKLPVSIDGMTAGFNSFIAKLDADSRLTVDSFAGADTFASLSFASNLDALSFGGTDYQSKKDITGEGDVFYVSFVVPADAKDGDEFPVNWGSLEVRNYEMIGLVPELEDGWIKIKTDETDEPTDEPTDAPTDEATDEPTDEPTDAPTDEATDEPTDAPTDEPTDAPTDEATDEPTDEPTDAPTDEPTEGPTDEPTEDITPSEEWKDISQEVAGKWVIGQEYAKPGEKVKLPVSIAGMIAGFNSFIAKLDADSRLTVDSFAGADTFASLSFASNLDALSFGGTDFQSKTDISGEGDVFYVYFVVPEDAKDGDEFPVNWGSLEVRNYEMISLIPELENGWIKVKTDETDEPTEGPTDEPTEGPTDEPTEGPTDEPTEGPTDEPTEGPTDEPTEEPTNAPTDEPTEGPTDEPTNAPTDEPTNAPTDEPTNAPTDEPTNAPTDEPTNAPTDEPTNAPTDEPTNAPTDEPTNAPTDEPTNAPTDEPTNAPTDEPTNAPTEKPTEAPTEAPTYAVLWDIQDGVVAKPGDTVTVKVFVEGDTTLCAFKAGVKPDSNLTYKGFEPSTAYGSWLSIIDNAKDAADIQFAGTLSDSAVAMKYPDIAGTNGVVMNLTFEVPAKKADGTEFKDGDILPITWVENQFEVQRSDGAEIIPELANGYIIMSVEDTEITYKYSIQIDGSDKFFFAHDPRPFDLAQMGGKLFRQAFKADGTAIGEPVEIMLSTVNIELSAYKLTGKNGEALTNPKAIYESGAGKQDLAYCWLPLQAKISEVMPDGTTIEGTLTPDSENAFNANVFIGVKGDTNLDGVCNASDAAKVLKFAAEYGASDNPDSVKIAADEKTENFVYFLSDVNGESEDHGKTSNSEANGTEKVNASDAALQLVYAAVRGASDDGTADWGTQVFAKGATLPKYTKEIADWIVANPQA